MAYRYKGRLVPESFPTWTQTLEEMVAEGIDVLASCDRCPNSRKLDTAALITLMAKVGPEYSLIDRRCRCKFRNGCPGWISFSYPQHSVFRPLRTDDAADRWMLSRD